MAQLTGTSGDDTLFGIGEADSINGLEGSDTIVGGAGNDTIESDHWIEFYIPDPSRPFNVITLHHYDDEVADHIDGGNGIDWARLDFHLNSSAVSLDFTNPAIQQTTAYGTTIVNVERIHFVGGSGGDTVTAGAYADTLSGGGGADILNGAGGDDHIAARFGDGADNLNGGDGVDLATLDFRFANGGGTYDFSNPAAVVALVEGTQIVNVERFDFQLSEHGEVVTGGGYDDKFNGNGGDDQLRGGGGNDLLSGSSGTDLLSGEGGDDTIEAYDDAGADTIDGGDGIDLLKLHLGFRTTAVSYSFADPFATTTLADGTTVIGVERVAIVGGSADDFFAGGGYDDSIDGNGGSDLVFGGGGNDFIVGDGGAFADERGNDTLDGGAGDDRISGMGGDDYLVGGDDDDSLAGGHGTDELYGQAGDDSLEAGFNDGADIVDGGDGIDLVIITASGDFGPSGDLIYNFSNPGAVYAIEGGATISNVERVDMTGASGNDQLTGGAYADRFLGFSGNDTLRGGGGNDSLNGMTGQDFLFGDAGEDDFTYILTAAGAADRDAIDGGADIDFIFLNHTLPTGPANYDFSNSAATITRPDGTTIVNVERIKYWGGTGVDTIGGGAYDDEILGAGGNDSILGRDGSDRLEGGSGEDFLNGDQGNDKVYGGEGGDTLFGGGYTGPENDELYGDAGTDFLVGSGGDDILDGGKDSDVDKLHGGVGNDTYHMYAGDIFATAAESGQGQEAEIDGFGGGVDHVISHASSYTLLYSFENLTLAANAVSGFGSEDDNEILGNDDNNLIGGNGGNDKIFGGTGRDTLSGGAGFDFFYLADGDAEAGESINGGADTDRIETASARLDLSGVTINELEAIQTVRGAGTAFIVDTAAHALLVNGGGGYDSLTVNDEALTAQQRNAIFAQGIETITDAAGTHGPNVAPSITSSGGGSFANLSLQENGNLIAQLTAADPDAGETLTWSISGGQDSAKFQINADNGVLSFLAAPDFENPTASGGGNVYGVTVRVSDGNGGFDEQNVFVEITDLNNFVGNGADNRIAGDNGADTMTGYGGNDTYIVDHAGDRVVEGVGGGIDVVQASVTFDLRGQEIENLTLTGFAQINGIGNHRANRLNGNSADNLLNGFGAADIMRGFNGSDIYYVDDADDQVIEGLTGDADRVVTSVSYTLAALSEVERLQTSNAALTTAISLGGNEYANAITGNAGVNTINGGGEADVMTGLDGSDNYYVNHAGDRVVEGLTGDADRVFASVSYRLATGSEVERLQTTDAALTTAIDLFGNEYANALTGNAGENLLNGGGAADTMTGLDGSDDYIVNDGSDRVVEAATGDVDRIFTSVSFRLGVGSEVERLQAANAALTTAIDLGGNEFANTITGNAGDNFINGGGAADRMTGLDGSDTYFVDDAADVVLEGLTGDIDRVFARVSYALAEDSEVERLQTTDAALTTAINLTGNEFANAITGNAGLNILDGGGGNDILTGLDGSDTYLVDRAGDIVMEGLTGDFDKIRTSTSYRLAVGSEIEALLTDRSTATTAINLTGNEYGNSIIGNSGINRLSGGGGNDVLAGGRGADQLTGGGGADRFDFNTLLNPVSNVDTITDFSAPQDTILLDRTVFAGIAVDGQLAASGFGLGTSAQDRTDRIVYDAGSGSIFYDSDGIGGAGAILFAKVNPNTPLTNADFTAYMGG